MHQARFTLHTQCKACATQYKTVCTSWRNTTYCQMQHNTTTWNWFNFSQDLQAFTSNWPIRYNCMSRLLTTGKYQSTMQAVHDPKLAQESTCNSSLAGDGRSCQARQISEPFRWELKVSVETPVSFHLTVNNNPPMCSYIFEKLLSPTPVAVGIFFAFSDGESVKAAAGDVCCQLHHSDVQYSTSVKRFCVFALHCVAVSDLDVALRALR